MDTIFNYNTTSIIIARYNESTDWVTKLNKYNNVHVYEKEKPEMEPYNIPENKGSEATAYLKFIIDIYNYLPNHIVLLHCHEYSWHHDDSIVTVLDKYINREIYYENINSNAKCGHMGDYQDWDTGEVADFYKTLIEPAVGVYTMYPKFTTGYTACAQFIIHKSIILKHSLQFYKDIYKWIMTVDVSFKNHGFYLEWTWHLFFNLWLQNYPIIKYEKEELLLAFQLDNKFKFMNDITEIVKQELNKNNHFKIILPLKIIIIKNNIITKEIIVKDNYIFNKFK